MQYLRFLDFYMSNDPKLELELRKLAEFRLVRFLVARTVRGKGRTVRRSWDLFTRGSAEKFSTAEIHCGRSAKGPRTVRLCWAVFARGSFSRAAV